MLISPAYAELQRDLHARYDYGKGVDAEECAALVRRVLAAGSVLDYGCGQGHLGRLLRPEYDVRDYDPCIAGLDAEPTSADVVVCADVLEHIEPELLGNVLQHIRKLARLHVVMVIATGPSGKKMADGRGAHVIVESASWWAAQLGEAFIIDTFMDRTPEGRGVLVVARPKPFEIGQINVVPATGNDERNANVRANCASVTKRLDISVPKHDRKAIVVCAGPSLIETWPYIAMERDTADVFTTSIAHKFLLDRNVVPVAHLDCDPREHKARQFGEPDARVQYWLASCVHPSYVGRLAGFDLSLWHSFNGKESQPVVAEVDPTNQMVVGGGSVGLRALSVLYCRGYRAFDIHGMDCSYADDGTDHCGEHLGKRADTVTTICGGRVFKSTPVHIAYARYFFKSQKMLKGATFNLYGDGLLVEMVRQGLKPDAVEGSSDV